MNKQNKTVSLIGFATKAGKVTFGCELTVGNVRKNKKNGVVLMLCSSDASENTKKRVFDCGAYHKVPVLCLEFTSSELASVTGKLHSVAVIGITDSGFARAISESVVRKDGVQ